MIRIIIDISVMMYKVIESGDMFGNILYNLVKVFEKIRSIYRGDFLVYIVYDSGNVWRKDIFKYYKFNRVKKDYNVIKMFNENMKEICNIFGFYEIRYDRMEADDLIYFLSKKFKDDICIIVHVDKDLLQIKRNNDNVKFFNIIKGEFVEYGKDEINKMLIDHVVRGDYRDGIPNMFMDDNYYVVEGSGRGKVITKRVMDDILSRYSDVEEMLKDFANDSKFLRNYKLIVFDDNIYGNDICNNIDSYISKLERKVVNVSDIKKEMRVRGIYLDVEALMNIKNLFDF